MDTSQSSDCFSEIVDASESIVPMDTHSYEFLVANTKNALSSDVRVELQKSTFASHFTSILVECSVCLNQSLDLVTGLLTDTEVCITKLTEYLSDSVCLLQLLSDFIKKIIESVSMACCSMKTFPTTTGQIIFTVFSHCKNSETLYGQNLTSVEKELKDLFRNCHELQLTYLMILEKHFLFDFTGNDEKDILIKALDINLKICEVVHSLDVKTMAEQWKAYTAICEKYCANILDTNIFQDCTQVLCMLIRNNIRTAIENIQDDKIVTRSLKVTSFTIKILLKICNIFKHATRKDYNNVLAVIFYMQTAYVTDLGMTVIKSQLKNLINVSIVNPSECLLKELLSDEAFCTSLLSCDLESIKNDDIFLGFVLTIMTAMRCLTQGYRCKTITKNKVIHCVYSSLAHCYRWLNHDVKLKLESEQAEVNGLFEHMLLHTAALALTLNSEEFVILERKMVEAILDTDCCSALFSSNLWAILARHVSSQLLFNQLVWLCTMYKKLENNKMFHRSPQKVHLSYTISRLFEVMPVEDKMKICKQFRIHDDDNVSLWTALGVNNLPNEVKCAAEDVVLEKLKARFQCFNGDVSVIMKLVQVISLAATCTFVNTRGIEDCVMRAWSKTCPRDNFSIQDLERSTVWFYDYLQALVTLTESIWHILCARNVFLIKLLHYISSVMQHCDTEFKLILIKTLCKLATSNICENKFAETNFTETFTCLFQDTEYIVPNMLFTTLRKYRRDKNLDRILSNIENCLLQESWAKIKEGQNYSNSEDNPININFKYSHKCFEYRSKIGSSCSSVSELKKISSSNFDFADVDDLFENGSDSEQPLCKKVKLNANEVEDIIKRLEEDASLLCKVKENVFTVEYKNRVQNVCDKLRNIIN